MCAIFDDDHVVFAHWPGIKFQTQPGVMSANDKLRTFGGDLDRMSPIVRREN